ncbi:hypothetical protein [Streptomyces sp. NPDC058953]|uniref:hypothetical protein n=1 Tax=unclassified Streptomyces TaxID=2593676 RepID=UPI003685CFAD
MLSSAPSGDARAYLPLNGHLRLITEDHNQCRAFDGHGDRNTFTACLGAGWDNKQTEERYGPPQWIPPLDRPAPDGSRSPATAPTSPTATTITT